MMFIAPPPPPPHNSSSSSSMGRRRSGSRRRRRDDDDGVLLPLLCHFLSLIHAEICEICEAFKYFAGRRAAGRAAVILKR